MTKDADPNCMLKSRFSATRLRDIVIGLKDPRRNLIIDRGWGVLLDICTFSAPKGLLEWIILRIDADLGEFRNTRNNISIVFNKEMVVRALGLPRGTRPVVLTGDHDESPYREFYKIEYNTAGKRAPIHHAEKMLYDDELDPETWFRTFFMVVIGTYFFPGTSIMQPLEYLRSLSRSTLVCEFDWAEQIFRHTMPEIKSFQEKMRKAAKDGNMKPVLVGGCLPWIAIVYMDHLDFPVSTLSSHRINYSIPRASHISDNDFKFVMKHDKSKLTLKPHTYGARPFRSIQVTPYAVENAILEDQAPQAHISPNVPVSNSNHLIQDASQHPTTRIRNFPEELPDYIQIIYEKHTTLWQKDVERVATRFSKIHGKRMAEYASDVFAAFKNNATTPHGSSPPNASMATVSPTRSSNPIIGATRDEDPVFVRKDVDNSDPLSPNQEPSTQFLEEASRIAAEVEKSAGKNTCRKDPSASTQMPTEDEDTIETARPRHPNDNIICPTFDLLPNGETWTQHLAASNQPSPRVVANISTSNVGPSNNTSDSAYMEKHTEATSTIASEAANTVVYEAPPADVGHISATRALDSKLAPIEEGVQYLSPGSAYTEKHTGATGNTTGSKLGTGRPLNTHNVAFAAANKVLYEATLADGGHVSATRPTVSKQDPIEEGGPTTSSVECKISTQTQDKKNRKKRAFLDRNNDANQKKLKKLKVTDKSKKVYDTYILRRCIRKPVGNEERPPFVDFGEYHVTYKEFCEALKPRDKIDKNVMELFIRHFNLVTNIPTTSESLCTKFAFSQSLTSKLAVPEDRFDPKTCLKEFQQVYKEHQLKSKDMWTMNIGS